VESAAETDTMIQTTYRSTKGQIYFSFSNLEHQVKEVMEMNGKPTLLAEQSERQ
jgi:hypothetical protein